MTSSASPSVLLLASQASLAALTPKIPPMSPQEIDSLRYFIHQFSTDETTRNFFAVDYPGDITSLLSAGPKANPDLIKLISHSSSPFLAQLANKAIANSQRSLEAMEQDAHSENLKQQLEVAENPYAPEEILRFLATLENNQIDLALAANQSTPADLLELYSNSDVPGLADAVALNPQTPESVLITYPDGEGYSELLLRNPALTTPVLLEILAQSKREPRLLLGHSNATYELAEAYFQKYPDSFEESRLNFFKKVKIFEENFSTMLQESNGLSASSWLTTCINFTYSLLDSYEKLEFMLKNFSTLKNLPEVSTVLLLQFLSNPDITLEEALELTDTHTLPANVYNTIPRLSSLQ